MTRESGGLIEGRCWVFSDANINTDLIMPSEAFRLPREERVRLIFSTVRPGWTELVEPGDVLIAGRNFGTGSSRPAADVMLLLGLGALVAESINDLFYRNCVNYAFPAMECPGILRAVAEGDKVRIDVREGRFTNLQNGATLRGPKMPDLLWRIIEAGGLYAQLRKDGFI